MVYWKSPDSQNNHGGFRVQGYAIPGFSRYSVDRKADGSWGIRSFLSSGRGAGTGGRSPGDFLPGSTNARKTIKLRSDNGSWVQHTLKWWVAAAGAVERVGLEIPGFSGYTIDQEPDGQWGVRSYQVRQGANLELGAFLAPAIGRDGRRHYVLMDDGRRMLRAQLAHFVLRATVGPPPFEGAHARHLNDDCLDCRPENLAWGTSRQNAADREVNGKLAHGERNGNSTLTAASARDIFTRYHRGRETQTELAKSYGLNQSSVSSITRRATWRHVTDDLAHLAEVRPRRRRGMDDAIVMVIARRHGAGESTTALANEFGVTRGMIREAALRYIG